MEPIPRSRHPYFERLLEFRAHAWDQSSGDIPIGRWAEFFPKSTKKIVYEIGCSNAQFLCEIAKANPHVGFVGLDWKFKVLYRGAQRIAAEQLKNVGLIRGLVQNSNHFFSENEVDEIWIFFPDPWAKVAQLKNRIMNETQLVQLAKLLKPGGRIYFKTDHPGYYQWVHALFGQPLPRVGHYDPLADAQVKAGARSRRIKQVKVRLPAGSLRGDIPPESVLLKRVFEFEYAATLPAEEFGSSSCFTSHKTLFEKVFEKEGLPGYGIQLLRNSESANRIHD